MHLGVNHTWIFHVLEQTELPAFIPQFLRTINSNSVTEWNLQEKPEDNFLWPEVSDKVALQVAFCLPWHSILSADGFMIRSSPKDPAVPESYNLLHALMPMALLFAP